MKIKPYANTTKNSFIDKKINFKRILKSISRYKDPSSIQQALSKGTISTKKYQMKKLQKKIKINNNSVEEKREIPYELLNIIEKSEKKYAKLNDEYQTLKKENNTFISYWHYTQKIKEKLDNHNNAKNALENDDNMDEYKKIKKMFQFSNRDKYEMELEKNLTKKIFKSNPLIISDNNELYFYFLGETLESKNKMINFNEQNSSKYLIKVKDLLEYVQIQTDKKMDDFNKRMKLQNCNFVQFQDKKIEEEKIKLLKEQKIKDKIERCESKKMINNTSRLLKQMAHNKDYLDDPNYFSFYKNNEIKCFTPNRNMEKYLMNKSSRTDFRLGEKNNSANRHKYEKYDTLRLLKLKKNNLSKQLSSLINGSINIKSKKIKKLRINNVSILDKYNSNESYSKDNNSTMNLNFYNSQISNNYNNSTKTIFLNKNLNKKILPSIKKYFPFNLPYNGFTKSSNSNSLIVSPIRKEENKKEDKGKDFDILDLINKDLNSNNIIANIDAHNNSKTIKSNNSSIISLKNNIKETENNIKETENNIKETENIIKETENNIKETENNIKETEINEKKIENKEKEIESNEKEIENNKKEKENKKIVIISDLYNEVKDMKKLNDENLKDINTYIDQNDIEYKRKKNTINIVKEAQQVTDEFDINKIVRNFIDVKRQEPSQIKKFKKINIKLKKLDHKCIRDICEFKAKNLINDYKFNL